MVPGAISAWFRGCCYTRSTPEGKVSTICGTEAPLPPDVPRDSLAVTTMAVIGVAQETAGSRVTQALTGDLEGVALASASIRVTLTLTGECAVFVLTGPRSTDMITSLRLNSSSIC